MSDIHQAEERMHRSVSQLTYTPDLIVLLGDVTSWMETKKYVTMRHDYRRSESLKHDAVIFQKENKSYNID